MHMGLLWPLKQISCNPLLLLSIHIKPEGEGPLGKPGCRWEHNNKINARAMGWGGVDWIELAQDKDQWRAVVGFRRMLDSCHTAAQLAATPEGLNFVE
jgi:hypothetical protein